MNRISELKQKEVINVSDGRRLGFVADVEINLEEGRIEALVLPGPGHFFGFKSKKDNGLVIPWERIEKIGEDIILVDLDDRFLRKYFDT